MFLILLDDVSSVVFVLIFQKRFKPEILQHILATVHVQCGVVNVLWNQFGERAVVVVDLTFKQLCPFLQRRSQTNIFDVEAPTILMVIF